MSTLDTARMTTLLAPWAEHVYGDGTVVSGVAPMPGNSGLSFGFAVHPTGGSSDSSSGWHLPAYGAAATPTSCGRSRCSAPWREQASRSPR